MFKRMSLRSKLLGLCAFMALLSVSIGAFSYRGLHEVEQAYSQITDDAFPSMNALNEMFLSYRALRINLRTLGLPGLTPEQAAESVQHVKESIEAYEKADGDYRSTPFAAGERELYEKLNARWLAFKQIVLKGLEYHSSGTREDHEKLLAVFLKDCPDAARDYTVAVNELKDFYVKLSRHESESAKSHAAGANRFILLLTLFGSLAGLVVSYLLASAISKKITETTSSLRLSANEVSAASEQIAHSSKALSDATTEQAGSLQQTASALEEINSMITRAAENANTTAQSSSQSQQKAEKGRLAMAEMLSAIEEINSSNDSIMTQIDESNRRMSEIVNLIQAIESKTKVINDIVFQTKLLSFNASVEAARAGENGKGFSVVAEEVGSLAQMSGNAAKEISSLLNGSVAQVNSIAEETKAKVENLMHQGKAKVEAGVRVAHDCSRILDEIAADVGQMSHLATEISRATTEQKHGVEEITKAMSQLDIVCQSNSSSSEQTASSAAALASQSVSMTSAVHDLTSIVEGDRSAA